MVGGHESPTNFDVHHFGSLIEIHTHLISGSSTNPSGLCQNGVATQFKVGETWEDNNQLAGARDAGNEKWNDPENHPTVQLRFLDRFTWFSGWVSEFNPLKVIHFQQGI